MDIDNLEKGIPLKKKLDFVKKANNDLETGICIYLGSQQRLDGYMDVHNRLKTVMQDELNRIEQETLDEISNI